MSLDPTSAAAWTSSSTRRRGGTTPVAASTSSSVNPFRTKERLHCPPLDEAFRCSDPDHRRRKGYSHPPPPSSSSLVVAAVEEPDNIMMGEEEIEVDSSSSFLDLDLSIGARAALDEHLRHVARFGIDDDDVEDDVVENGDHDGNCRLLEHEAEGAGVGEERIGSFAASASVGSQIQQHKHHTHAQPTLRDPLDDRWERLLNDSEAGTPNASFFLPGEEEAGSGTDRPSEEAGPGTTTATVEMHDGEAIEVLADLSTDYFNSSRVNLLMTPEKNRLRPPAVTRRRGEHSLDTSSSVVTDVSSSFLVHNSHHDNDNDDNIDDSPSPPSGGADDSFASRAHFGLDVSRISSAESSHSHSHHSGQGSSGHGPCDSGSDEVDKDSAASPLHPPPIGGLPRRMPPRVPPHPLLALPPPTPPRSASAENSFTGPTGKGRRLLPPKSPTGGSSSADSTRSRRSSSHSHSGNAPIDKENALNLGDPISSPATASSPELGRWHRRSHKSNSSSFGGAAAVGSEGSFAADAEGSVELFLSNGEVTYAYRMAHDSSDLSTLQSDPITPVGATDGASPAATSSSLSSAAPRSSSTDEPHFDPGDRRKYRTVVPARVFVRSASVDPGDGCFRFPEPRDSFASLWTAESPSSPPPRTAGRTLTSSCPPHYPRAPRQREDSGTFSAPAALTTAGFG